MAIDSQPTATAEYLVVDVETNGRSGDLCEPTEVGAVLVGGGELHDRYESLVRVEAPLGRGIERFTGITQAMLTDAPEPLPVMKRIGELARGRALVAHNAAFDRRVLRQAFDRCSLEWPDPPVLCTVAMARRFAPLATRRGLGELAASLGIEVDVRHRALADAIACARIFCALFPKLAAAAASVEEAARLLGPRRRRARRRAPPRPREERPDLSRLPRDPGVYIFRDEEGRPVYVGKSISLRSRARTHFCAPSGWTDRAAVVDYRATNSELGALVLENRLIKRWRPGGNVRLKRTDRYVYLRCRLDIPYPVLDVGPSPAAGHAVNVGPLRGRAAAESLAGELNSLFKLRHCGRALPRRDHPSLYGQIGRCLSPCLGDLDPNLYRAQVDRALELFAGDGEASALVVEHLEHEMRAASEARLYERAEVLRRRRERLSAALDRLTGVLRAVHCDPRIVLAPHPSAARLDAFWVVAGRVVDWGSLPALDELAARTARVVEALRAPGRRAAPLPRDEVDEVRIVSAWLAGHETAQLPLDEPPDRGSLERFVEDAVSAAGATA